MTDDSPEPRKVRPTGRFTWMPTILLVGGQFAAFFSSVLPGATWDALSTIIQETFWVILVASLAMVVITILLQRTETVKSYGLAVGRQRSNPHRWRPRWIASLVGSQ